MPISQAFPSIPKTVLLYSPCWLQTRAAPYLSVKIVGVTDMCSRRSNLEISWLVSGD